MSETQITADDITHWETIDDIATSLKKRGLKPRPSLDRENGFEDELLIETEEDKYIALIEASPGDEPSDYNRFQSRQSRPPSSQRGTFRHSALSAESVSLVGINMDGSTGKSSHSIRSKSPAAIAIAPSTS